MTGDSTQGGTEAAMDARLRTYYSGRRVCVTGGAGFIGGHLCRALLVCGAEVIALDDLSTGSAEVAGELMDRYPTAFRFIHASILEPAAMDEAVERCGIVFHQAACVSVPRSIEDPERTFAVNALGTARAAEAARRAGAARLVYAASSSAYGDAEASPKREDLLPAPKSPYAASKLAGEQVMRSWADSYAMDTVSLRYFNIFGEGQRGDSPYAAVIARFIERLDADGAPTIYGDGEQTRDFTHVANAVRANLLAGAAPDPLGGSIMNIGCGEATSVRGLLERVAALMHRADVRPVHEAARMGDVRHSLADISRARDVLGYEPVVGLEEGLKRTLSGASGGDDSGVVGRISRSAG